VSRQFGRRNVWPGDTIGIFLLPTHGHAPQKIQLSWGSAVSGSPSCSRNAVTAISGRA